MPRILVTRRLPEPALDRLRAAGTLDLHDADRPMTRDELLTRVRGVDALLCLLTDRVDEALMDAGGPSLRVISNYAVGVDNVDLGAATARRIPVTNTPDVLTDATADLAWALLLAAVRRVAGGDPGPLRVRPHRPGRRPARAGLRHARPVPRHPPGGPRDRRA
jgi:glyoxylate reductase